MKKQLLRKNEWRALGLAAAGGWGWGALTNFVYFKTSLPAYPLMMWFFAPPFWGAVLLDQTFQLQSRDQDVPLLVVLGGLLFGIFAGTVYIGMKRLFIARLD
ncbi:MAG: hypothetical protein HC875_03975 [Anaerolineales bacterium]|nr:hypothetical protein [Anaerolineales bacterium]